MCIMERILNFQYLTINSGSSIGLALANITGSFEYMTGIVTNSTQAQVYDWHLIAISSASSI